MANRAIPAIVMLLVVAPAGDAPALTIVSQVADISVSSWIGFQPQQSESEHITGLAPIDRTLTSEQGDANATYGFPPGYAAGVSHLETDFGADFLYVAGWVTADATFDGTIDVDAGEPKAASSAGSSDLVIHFTLEQGSRVEGISMDGTNLSLSHDTLGFDLFWETGGADTGYDCGSIPYDLQAPNPCDTYFEDFPSSGYLPAGDYTLTANTWAFEDDPRPGSCAVGCGSMGPFALTLFFVPEPGTLALLSAGLLVLAARRRVPRRRA